MFGKNQKTKVNLSVLLEAAFGLCNRKAKMLIKWVLEGGEVECGRLQSEGWEWVFASSPDG